VDQKSFSACFTLPTAREFAILEWLWEQGPASLGDIHRAFGKAWGVRRQVTNTVVQVMLEKGLLAQHIKGYRAFYHSAYSRLDLEHLFISALATTVFHDSLPALLLSLYKHPHFRVALENRNALENNSKEDHSKPVTTLDRQPN
jgi:BlaI family transcriptional regulator, penicillinase repressor